MENTNKGPSKSLLARIDWLSWSGIILILVAYFLNAGSYISASSWWFLWMNALGATAYIIWGFHKRHYSVVFMNCIWCLIAIYHMLF